MDLDKAWLYRQGNWTEIDDPAAQFPEDRDNWPEVIHCNQEPRTYGVPGEHYVTIYYGPSSPRRKVIPLPIPTTPTMSRSRSRG